MNIVNPLRHPQTLFMGFREDDPRLLAMQEVVGASLVIGTSGFRKLRDADWDLLVAESVDLADVDLPHHIYVLAFDCDSLGVAVGTHVRRGPGSGSKGASSVRYEHTQHSRELHVISGSPESVKRLVQTESVDQLESRSPMPHLNIRGVPTSGFSADHCVSFLADADDYVVVGEFQRSISKSLCWALPYVSQHPIQWLMAALGEWHQHEPERFPEASPWRENQRWMTAEELATVANYDSLRSEWRAAEERYKRQELELATRVADASAAADAGLRRLLTEQGDSLVQVVTEALRGLGFNVIDRDSEREKENLGKVEDLAIVDPSHEGVSIIAEVKGYAKRGANQKDLMQLNEHAVAFAARNGKAPDRRWYIINQCAQEPPDSRPAPLASVKEHREIFAEAGGLVIDTRNLFQLARDVAQGSLTPEFARELLVGSTNVLNHPRDEP